MCVHENLVLDYSSGDEICSECGLVTDRIMLCKQSESVNIELFAREDELTNVVNKLEISSLFYQEIVLMVKRIQQICRCSQTHALSLSLYIFCCDNEILRPLHMILYYCGISQKDFSKVLKCYSRHLSRGVKNIVDKEIGIMNPCFNNDSSNLNLNYFQQMEIMKHVKESKCLCLYHPNTIFASFTYLYLKKEDESITVKDIAQHFNISAISVYRYMNTSTHACAVKFKNSI